MWTDPGNIITHIHINVEIGIEAAQFPEKDDISLQCGRVKSMPKKFLITTLLHPVSSILFRNFFKPCNFVHFLTSIHFAAQCHPKLHNAELSKHLGKLHYILQYLITLTVQRRRVKGYVCQEQHRRLIKGQVKYTQ
jgi:hypothetical protein